MHAMDGLLYHMRCHVCAIMQSHRQVAHTPDLRVRTCAFAKLDEDAARPNAGAAGGLCSAGVIAKNADMSTPPVAAALSASVARSISL